MPVNNVLFLFFRQSDKGYPVSVTYYGKVRKDIIYPVVRYGPAVSLKTVYL